MRVNLPGRKLAWLLVVSAALALSNWSLAYVAQRWGVPRGLAYIVSAVFDGVALLCADLALKAARNGDSTAGPGAFLLIFGALSAWFNSYHAALAGLPWPGRVFYAVPPVAALVAVELQLRHDRRGALRERGRIAAPLPAFGMATWCNKPLASYHAQRAVMAYRLKGKLSANTGARPPAGGRAEPRPERAARQPVTGTRVRATDADRAALVVKLRNDAAAGLPISVNKVADRHGATRWTAAEAIRELNGSAT